MQTQQILLKNCCLHVNSRVLDPSKNPSSEGLLAGAWFRGEKPHFSVSSSSLHRLRRLLALMTFCPAGNPVFGPCQFPCHGGKSSTQCIGSWLQTELSW